MRPLHARKRCRTSEHENNAKSPGTDSYVSVQAQTVKQKRKRKANCEAEVKPKKAKVGTPSQAWKSPFLEGQKFVPSKRKAKGEAEVQPKNANVESPSQTWKSPLLEGQIVSKKVTTEVSASRVDFQSKYLELEKLGSGGYGSVFVGLQDGYLVAIKHIPQNKVVYKKVVQNGVEYSLINEVALIVKVAWGPCPAVVRLLDCYKFPDEVVIVMERPYPAQDLLHYKYSKGGVLKEDEAKMILKQMVEACIQMHNSGVFHRDLKLENILVELGHRFPKVRVIDFAYHCYSGTFSMAPPECYSSKEYRAEPTTVYHLGTLLYDLFHCEYFSTYLYLNWEMRFDEGLSEDCLDFLRSCLACDPVKRPCLVELQRHPWLH